MTTTFSISNIGCHVVWKTFGGELNYEKPVCDFYTFNHFSSHHHCLCWFFYVRLLTYRRWGKVYGCRCMMYILFGIQASFCVWGCYSSLNHLAAKEAISSLCSGSAFMIKENWLNILHLHTSQSWSVKKYCKLRFSSPIGQYGRLQILVNLEVFKFCWSPVQDVRFIFEPGSLHSPSPCVYVYLCMWWPLSQKNKNKIRKYVFLKFW